MTDTPPSQPPGWYYAQGDPPGTQRYWSGAEWEGEPQPIPGWGGAATGGPAIVDGLLARPGRRLAARVIDWLLWSGVYLGVLSTLGEGVTAADEAALSTPRRLLVAGSVIVALAMYETVMVSVVGATAGKLALGLRVTDLDGGSVDPLAALLRFSPLIALMALVQVPIIGGFGFIVLIVLTTVAVMMLFTDRSVQVPWDKLAKTLVVNAGAAEG